jgi:hypothetical protein
MHDLKSHLRGLRLRAGALREEAAALRARRAELKAESDVLLAEARRIRERQRELRRSRDLLGEELAVIREQQRAVSDERKAISGTARDAVKEPATARRSAAPSPRPSTEATPRLVPAVARLLLRPLARTTEWVQVAAGRVRGRLRWFSHATGRAEPVHRPDRL